jgi:hypothetical protein
MKLIRRDEITVTSWINDKIISTPNWQVFAEIENDSLFFSIQEPGTGNQLKIKIDKITKEINKDENNQENKSENEGTGNQEN